MRRGPLQQFCQHSWQFCCSPQNANGLTLDVVDMSYMTVCGPPWMAGRLAILFLFVYPVGVAVLWRYRRKAIGPMASSVLPMILTPIFVGLAASWLEIVRVLQRLSFAGGGRAASAAGFSEGFVPVAFSCAVAALVAGVAWLRDLGRGLDQPPARQSSSKFLIPTALVMIGLAALASAEELSIARRIVFGASPPTSLAWTRGVFWALLAAAVTSLIWLLLSRRTPAAQFQDWRRGLALGCTMTSIALCYGAYRLSKAFWAIAISG